MPMNIIVLAKQVPDTHNVGPDAMTAEGTVNRGALPAVFNPEDLNALEQALRLKERYGASITMLTMGLPKAADVLREGVFRGADEGILLTDRALGGADTLATSYSLSQAIRKIRSDRGLSGEDFLILCGRQAIDGDTAQVGPQVAEKLGLPQVTYVEEVLSVEDGVARVRRHIDGGVETVECPLPCLLTVNGSAATCRSRNVKRVMANKHREFTQWGAADIAADPAQIGKAGSPTNVKAVRNIVFKAKESKTLTASDEDIKTLVNELRRVL
ncbi:MAG: electron transfer flavoprotein subunit beta/FixA family protein [Bacteroidaceae bacterium]|nr:electron transfer flavoprotein subunit beta/FixA family protein [Bacteroidaceae bacterium]